MKAAHERMLGVAALTLALATPVATYAATGRLIVTGGATTVEGVAGGGVVPLALISGLGSRDEIGGTGYGTYLKTDDYDLKAGGVAINLFDRFELSFGHLSLGIDDSTTGKAVIGAGVASDHIEMDVVGLKYKLVGDAMYAPDEWLPQVALGVQYKKNHEKDLMDFLSADDDGVDYYVAASKVFHGALMGRNTLVNGVLRYTKSNYLGLFGFGNDGPGGSDGYQLQFEFSSAVLLTTKLVLGVEYKSLPDNKTLDGAVKYQDWKDIFIGYFPTKNISIIGAYADLGQIGLDADDNQDGFYLSAQLTF